MSNDVNILHHIGVLASNLDALVARYERLGFTLSPLSHAKIVLRPGAEPEMIGASNRCAIFQKNYLELLGIFDKNRWDSIPKEQLGPYNIDESLVRYEGLHVMDFGADDLDVARERLVKQGTACSEIGIFTRNVDTPNGERMMCARVLHFPPGSNPEARIKIDQHVTPELVLQPRYMVHRNGSRALTECIVCVTDPATIAAKYELYTGRKSERVGNLHLVDLGYSTVIVLAPEHLGDIIPDWTPPTLPYLPGFTVVTADVDATRKLLIENDVAFQEYGGRLIVRPEEAGGSAVLFEKEGATRRETR